MQKTSLVLALVGATLLGGRANAGSEPFQQRDLVSDRANQAANRDADLVNPWGLVVSRDGVLRVADEGTGKLTFYRDNGRKMPDVVDVHGEDNDPGPTGLILNTSSSAFRFTRAGERRSAMLIAVNTDGSISAFHPQTDRNDAVEVAHRSNAAYLGGAIAERNGKPYLFVANFAAGTIDIYDREWNRVSRNGAFEDSRLPNGYAPFNIMAHNNRLYVAYAKKNGDEETTGPGLGYVNVFDTRGRLRDRLIARGRLNAPWGMVVAPSGLGDFSHALLVGNFGDGRINAFNLRTGRFIGMVETTRNRPVENEGLWGLAFGTGSNQERRTLYFTAGVDDEHHGLLGELRFMGRRGDGDDDDDDDDDLVAQQDMMSASVEGESGVGLSGDEIAALGVEESPGVDEFMIVEPALQPAEDAVAQAAPDLAVSTELRVAPSTSNVVRLGSDAVRFRISANATDPVRFEIFDVSGRLVARPLHDELLAGRDEVRWDGRDLRGAPVASGTYLYRAIAGAQSVKGRVIVLR